MKEKYLTGVFNIPPEKGICYIHIRFLLARKINMSCKDPPSVCYNFIIIYQTPTLINVEGVQICFPTYVVEYSIKRMIMQLNTE